MNYIDESYEKLTGEKIGTFKSHLTARQICYLILAEFVSFAKILVR